MSLLDMQTAIARICVDHHFRRVFLADPGQALAAFDLTDEECDAVKGINVKAIQQYAESLVRKRMGVVTKWFPLTMAALQRGLPAEQLQRLLGRYGLENIRDQDELGGEWVRAEFIRFRDYLRACADAGEIDVAHFADILEFESTRQQMSHDPGLGTDRLDETGLEDEARRLFAEEAFDAVKPLLGAHARIRPFGCNIVALLSHLENATAPPRRFGAEPTWVLFVRKRSTAKVVVQSLHPSLSELLELCDGTRTTREILALAVARHARPLGPREEDVRGDCLAVLQQLYTTGILTHPEPVAASVL